MPLTTVKRVQVGDTFKMTWISSGTVPTSIVAAIISGSETIVASGSGVSSGNGHFYRAFSVNSPGWYAAVWSATIQGFPYQRRIRFKAVLGEVD